MTELINQIVSSGVITSLFLGIIFITLFYFSSGIFAEIFNMPHISNYQRNKIEIREDKLLLMSYRK
jgi:hypothetical protein